MTDDVVERLVRVRDALVEQDRALLLEQLTCEMYGGWPSPTPTPDDAPDARSKDVVERACALVLSVLCDLYEPGAITLAGHRQAHRRSEAA